MLQKLGFTPGFNNRLLLPALKGNGREETMLDFVMDLLKK